jgi:hypothetical protein
VEAGNLDDAIGAVAKDAVLHSPVTFKPIDGKANIGKVLGIVAEILGDFRYTHQVESKDDTLGLILLQQLCTHIRRIGLLGDAQLPAGFTYRGAPA